MRVRIVAFARVAELLGWTRRELDLPAGATARDAWNEVEKGAGALRGLAESTRLARNGRVVKESEVLSDGDELALLPPAGGG